MGAYLSKPVLDKHSETGESDALRYGATCMQGWRLSQEDAHNCLLNFDGSGASFFAVYDGHGGHEVAEYSAKMFPTFLGGLDTWKDRKIKESLVDGFLEFDASLIEPEVAKELNRIASVDKSEHGECEDDDQDEDKDLLLEEAFLPLDELARRYGFPMESLEYMRTRRPLGIDDADTTDEPTEQLVVPERRGKGVVRQKKRDASQALAVDNVGSGVPNSDETDKENKPKTPPPAAPPGGVAEPPSVNGVVVGSTEQDAEAEEVEIPPVKKLKIDSEGVLKTDSQDVASSLGVAEPLVKKDNSSSSISSSLQNGGEQTPDTTMTGGERHNANGHNAGEKKEAGAEEAAKNGHAEIKIGKPRPFQVDIDNCLKCLQELLDGKFDDTADYFSMLDYVRNEVCPNEGGDSVANGPFSLFSLEAVGSMYKRVGDKHLKDKELGKAAEAYSAGFDCHPDHPELREVIVNDLSLEIPFSHPQLLTSLKRKHKGKDAVEKAASSGGEEQRQGGADNGAAPGDEEGDDADYEESKSGDQDEDEDGTSEEESSSGEDGEEEDDSSDEGEVPDGLPPGITPEMLFDQKAAGGVTSGTTACVAVLVKDLVAVANAGDSRCVLCRAGAAVDLSVDHKPEDPEELARIERAGGHIHDGRVNGGLNLSRAIGDHSYKRNKELPLAEQMISALPDIQTTTLQPEDEFLVLACDGIWNSMSSQEVVDFVKDGITRRENLDKICERLCDKCLATNTYGDGEGCDNMTVIVVVFKANEKPPPALSSAGCGSSDSRHSAVSEDTRESVPSVSSTTTGPDETGQQVDDGSSSTSRSSEEDRSIPPVDAAAGRSIPPVDAAGRSIPPVDAGARAPPLGQSAAPSERDGESISSDKVITSSAPEPETGVGSEPSDQEGGSELAKG